MDGWIYREIESRKKRCREDDDSRKDGGRKVVR